MASRIISVLALAAGCATSTAAVATGPEAPLFGSAARGATGTLDTPLRRVTARGEASTFDADAVEHQPASVAPQAQYREATEPLSSREPPTRFAASAAQTSPPPFGQVHVRRAVRRIFDRVRSCYEQVDMSGGVPRILVAFTVEPSGEVSDVTRQAETRHRRNHADDWVPYAVEEESELAACLVAVVADLEFESVPDAAARVVYPFDPDVAGGAI